MIFKFGDKVIIHSGFHEGLVGTIVDVEYPYDDNDDDDDYNNGVYVVMLDMHTNVMVKIESDAIEKL